MEFNWSEAPRRSSQRLRELVRKNSEKFGDAAEAVVLPKNRRSFKRRASITNQNDTIDLERRESIESECLDPNKRSFPLLITLITFVQIGVMLFAKNWTWLTLCQDPYRRHEIWRFITVVLVHSSSISTVFNVIFELLFGLTLEVVQGWKRVGGIYVSGVIAGSLVGTIIQPKNYGLGASGGIYGLLTAHLATLLLNWSQMERRTLRFVCIMTYVGLDICLAYLQPSSITGYAAYFGGAIGGFIAALFLLRNFEVLDWEITLKKIVCGVGIAIFLVIVLLNVCLDNYFYSSEFNFNYVETYFKHTFNIVTIDENYDDWLQLCAQNPQCNDTFSVANASLAGSV